MKRDAIMTELLEIEGLLQDEGLNDNDRHALHGAQQALCGISSTRDLAPSPSDVLSDYQQAERGRFPASALATLAALLMLHLGQQRMKRHVVRHARQGDTNREFRGHQGIEWRWFTILLFAFAIINYLAGRG